MAAPFPPPMHAHAAPPSTAPVAAKPAEAFDANPDSYESEGKGSAAAAEEEVEWTAHDPGDGRVFYYNVKSGESTWDKPEGFKEKAVSKSSHPVSWEPVDGTDWMEVKTDDGKRYYFHSKKRETSWAVPEAVKKAKEARAEDLKAAEAAAIERIRGKIGDPAEAAPESQSAGEKADDGEAEAAAAGFREMLIELGVTPFSKWEKELPKLCFDPRYKRIPEQRKRRALFDLFVRTRADEVRKEKRAVTVVAREGFRALLDEAEKRDLITIDTTQATLEAEKGIGDDERWSAVEAKEREAMLNERVAPLKKALEEVKQAELAAATAAFHQLLQSKNLDVSMRWPQAQSELRDEPAFQAVPHFRREILYRAFMQERAQHEEKFRKLREDQQKVEELRRQHEREIRKRKEREAEEVDRRKAKLSRMEAIASFQTLLSEQVKDAEDSWRDARRRLEREASRAVNNLDESDKERIFRDHVAALVEKHVAEFKQLLKEVLRDAPRSAIESWSEAKRLLRKDERYDRCPKKDREKLFRRFAEDHLERT